MGRMLRLLLVVGLVGCFAGCEDNGGGGVGSNVGDNNINVVVALGDSITAGSGATPWPSLLAASIGKSVINAGRGGDTAAGGAARAPGLLSQHSPGYLLILLGTNDAIQSRGVDGTIAALRSIVSQARARQTIPVLATLPPMTAGHVTYNPGAQARNARIRALASELGCALADVASAFGSGEGLLMENGLHPNNAGQQAIANAFASVF